MARGMHDLEEWNGLLCIREDARQALKDLLWGCVRPRDLSPNVWTALCRGELASMSGHTLACLIDSFGFLEISEILKSSIGFQNTIIEAWRIIGGQTQNNVPIRRVLKNGQRYPE